MRAGTRLWWFLLGLIIGCSANDQPAPGMEGGACLPDGSCNPPLACVLGTCSYHSGPETGPEPDGGSPDGGDSVGNDGDEFSDGDGANPPADQPFECRFPDPISGPWSSLYTQIEHLQDLQLRESMFDLVDGHHSLGYDSARRQLFSDLNNRNGYVQCVYTGEWVETNEVPSGSVMNTEHTWCQSWGADTEPAVSDLHHLFPVTALANSKRSSYHFGDVVDASWSDGGSSLGLDAAMHRVFEVRDQHKGDCARAMFYFALRYERAIPDYEEAVLRQWNCLDLPDEDERARNDTVEDLQNNRNPFIDRPDLVESIGDF